MQFGIHNSIQMYRVATFVNWKLLVGQCEGFLEIWGPKVKVTTSLNISIPQISKVMVTMTKYGTIYCLGSHHWICTLQWTFLRGQCVTSALRQPAGRGILLKLQCQVLSIWTFEIFMVMHPLFGPIFIKIRFKVAVAVADFLTNTSKKILHKGWWR